MCKIGVVGAGVIGVGVAQKFAQYGHEVTIIDVSNRILEEARESIIKNIKFFNMFNRDKMVNKEEVISKINFTTNYSELLKAEFIIENVPEIAQVKKEVYEKLDTVASSECIYLVNTSCISITKIASYTKRKDKVIGTHFMNPVPVKRAVEVIKGYHTSTETIEKVEKLLSGIEIEVIIVNDLPGFVSNRVSHVFMNEAAYTVQDNVASPEKVDLIFKKCFEHKLGPLETADLIGLDTVVNSLDILYESYQDSKFRCCPLLRKMVDAGLLGRKSGKGFYEY
ncbi:3-hydroxyacyl-CoA dehydrogenase family protein [Clostridium tagluense]|uniref:3-hydroxyacyl-CoA dehydrogenase family protein n=1 Tax=Clostridium tagluense TaxID=360422 RepID=UPI001CF3D27A|nr:3-hydroxyacyl-CoA dehydrogenase family protein [Clostridium tagluense]MCB2298656.1 3-hydroxyacyl-CoA dehydrogenase family protein [Clostridium tagluense]